MPVRVDNILHYTKAEIDALVFGSVNSVSVLRSTIVSVDTFTLDTSGTIKDGFYYGDLTHNLQCDMAFAVCIMGADAELHGGIPFQRFIDEDTLRIWIPNQPTGGYALRCLLLYA